VLALDGAVVVPTEADLPAAQDIVDEMLSSLTALAEPVANTWAPALPQALPLTHLDPPQPVPFHSDSALVHELDEAGWVKVLDAGPALLALEFRQLGGLFAAPAANGGALDHFTAPNFVDHFQQPQRTHDDTHLRVERVRRVVDPTGLFAGDVGAVR
jgi:hypothetical protein